MSGDSTALCPVCLEALADQPTLQLPGCLHAVHVACALQSAQYDTRCPICRNQCVAPRERDDVYAHIGRELQERIAAHRLYQSRRNRLIRRRESLRRLRERLRHANRAYVAADKELDKVWSQALREVWTTHPAIMALRKVRESCLRRRSRYDRELRRRLADVLGDPPEIVF